MRELNAAWEVLRNPARRAEYDRQLRGDTPVWEQSGARAKRTAPVNPRVADLQPRHAAARGDVPSGVRVGPIIAIVMVVVAAILGLAAWVTASSSDDGGEVNVHTGASFDEGTCVVLASVDGRITALSSECSAIGAMRIVQVLDLGRPCSSPLEAFDLQTEQIRLCLRAS